MPRSPSVGSLSAPIEPPRSKEMREKRGVARCADDDAHRRAGVRPSRVVVVLRSSTPSQATETGCDCDALVVSCDCNAGLRRALDIPLRSRRARSSASVRDSPKACDIWERARSACRSGTRLAADCRRPNSFYGGVFAAGGDLDGWRLPAVCAAHLGTFSLIYTRPRTFAAHHRVPTSRKRQSEKNSGGLPSKACPTN
jgi:hypothetical protein